MVGAILPGQDWVLVMNGNGHGAALKEAARRVGARYCSIPVGWAQAERVLRENHFPLPDPAPTLTEPTLVHRPLAVLVKPVEPVAPAEIPAAAPPPSAVPPAPPVLSSSATTRMPRTTRWNCTAPCRKFVWHATDPTRKGLSEPSSHIRCLAGGCTCSRSHSKR